MAQRLRNVNLTGRHCQSYDPHVIGLCSEVAQQREAINRVCNEVHNRDVDVNRRHACRALQIRSFANDFDFGFILK